MSFRLRPISRLTLLPAVFLVLMSASRSSSAQVVDNAQTAKVSAPAERLVFAHYMLAFGSSVEFYKQEIELAQRSGINGFALNAGEWLRAKDKPTNYVGSGERIYEAAKQLNSGFKLFFSPDLNGLSSLPMNIGDMVARFKDHPNQLKHNGKVVMSGWGGSPSSYAAAINKIKTDGTDVFFVPFVYPPRFPINWSEKTARRFFENQPHMDGVFSFGADSIYPEIIRTNATARRVTKELGKLYMASATPAFNSPNLRDYRGMEGYSKIWENIIRDQADWVELVTWNDYNEDSNLMPFRWPLGAEKNHISRDESFLDLTAYYSMWFKTGIRPEITQDKLYYSYRNRAKHLTNGWNPHTKQWYDITRGEGRVDQIHDDVEDNIYVTTTLTAPAELTVEQGKGKSTFEVPAGIHHVSVPMQPGVPRFILRRKNGRNLRELLNISGRKLIIDKATEENSVAGYHLQNRTWNGGAVAGESTRYEAESGSLEGGATLVKEGAATAVQNLEKDNSGVTIPIKGLKTGIYNIRIRYSNPSSTEARLTLFADGAPRAEKEIGNYIPAFLPPTAKRKYETTSFLWSLYDKTSYLRIAWILGREWGQPKPYNDDKGSVFLDAVEIIPVAPVLAPKSNAKPLPKPTITTFAEVLPQMPATLSEIHKSDVPEMISIPGGTFTMGSTDGAPDEAPAHQVTVSDFAIARTEITNAQFEKFDPAHRDMRDEFSHRDSDPVIYVSWFDCAKYCNWLSAQQGLSPVYDEKTWQVDPKANGYRLPTEAEWEYVASGRGENRKYPWGNDAPDATRGNFLLKPPGSPGLPIDFIGHGTVPVGNFPAGASRDGVLDMAGNAAEWCADFYWPYSTETQTNPLNQTPTNYRVIRGNSWGYYGRSARSTDREFNSPGYPGYIYLGFRVARSKIHSTPE